MQIDIPKNSFTEIDFFSWIGKHNQHIETSHKYKSQWFHACTILKHPCGNFLAIEYVRGYKTIYTTFTQFKSVVKELLKLCPLRAIWVHLPILHSFSDAGIFLIDNQSKLYKISKITIRPKFIALTLPHTVSFEDNEWKFVSNFIVGKIIL